MKLALLFLCVGYSADTAPGAVAAWSRGVRPMKSRQVATAPGTVSASLISTAQAPTAADLYQKAHALFQQQKYEAALTAVEAALQLNSQFVPALTLKARLAMTANRFDVAAACLRQVVALEPQSATHHFLLGFALYVANDFAAALPPLEQAARLQANDARTHFYLALTYEGLGRVTDALASYEQSLRRDKSGGADLADTLVAYARLLFTLGRFDESEKLIDRALNAERDSRDAHYEKGRLRLEYRDYAAAIKHGQQALALSGVGTTERQIHFLLARAYGQNGQPELAAAHLAKFRAAPPTLRR
jgi:tetratricopeptide (TPR) repeat protein